MASSTTSTTKPAAAATSSASGTPLAAEWQSIADQVQLLLAKCALRVDEVNRREQRLQELDDSTAANVKTAKAKIKLDIGGQTFSTSRTTLLSQPDSYFSAMLGSGKWQPDDDGSYFVDRDPVVFPLILNWLRTGVLEDLTAKQRRQIQADADYYRLDALLALVAVEPLIFTDSRTDTAVGGQGGRQYYRAAGTGWTTGQYRVIFHVLQQDDQVMLGVAAVGTSLPSNPFVSSMAACGIWNNGQIYAASGHSPFGAKPKQKAADMTVPGFRGGDDILMEVDCDARTLRFSNNVTKAVLCNTMQIYFREALTPAVSLSDSDSVRIEAV